MTPQRKDADEATFEFATFLATSARGCIEEPALYGSLRLLDALSRFVEFCRETGLHTPDPFLEQAKKIVDENSDLIMSGPERFKQFTDGLVRNFAREIKRRAAR